MEYDRLSVSPKLQNVVDNNESEEEEAIAILDGQHLFSLVGVVFEVDLNDAMLGSLYELKASGQKSKSALGKKSSKRGRVSKSEIMS
jgi:hypothetical protein